MRRILIFVKNKLALLAAITAAAIIGGATTGLVIASIPDSSGTIHGCRTTLTGAIRVIDSASQSCNGLETALNWSQNVGNSGQPFTCGLCNLSHEGSRLSGQNLSNSYLATSSMENINLSSTNFTNAVVFGATFYGSDLSSANFTGDDMTGVTFAYTNLSGTNLTNTNLTSANFTGATNMNAATLSGVTWAGTTCADGTNSDDNSNTCAGHLTP